MKRKPVLFCKPGGMTCKEIADVFGVKRQYVDRIEKEALAKIRRRLRDDRETLEMFEQAVEALL